MTARTVRLVDGDREFLLHRAQWPRDDVILTNLDAPAPAVRAVVEDRTNADGTIDSTARHGARAVSAEVVLFDRPAALVEELTRFMNPRARPYLCIDDDEWGGERRLLLRADQFSAPMPTESHLFRKMQLQWQAPSGVWEATDPVTFELNAEAEDTTGRVYPEAFPRIYPAAIPRGRVLHDNPGTEPADQTVRLYGPCVGPRYTNDTTGETLVFAPELVLGLGEYVEVNTAAHTAYADSDPAASRAHYLDYEVSTWWQMPPGQSVVRYHPTAEVDAGCGSVTAYRPGWLDF